MTTLRHPLRAIRGDLAHVPRYPALDGLRGIAIIGVVVYHTVRIWAESGSWNGHGVRADTVPRALWWLATGRLGVDLLFVLSGFLVFGSWESIRRHASGLGHALRSYLFRRGQRIYPAYWLSLVVFSIWLAPGLLRGTNWRQVLLFIPAQAYWVRGLPDQINTVYWTLTTELLFYALLPVLAIGLRRRPVLTWLGCVVCSYLWVHGDLEAIRGDLGAGWIGGRLDQFAVGAAVAVLLTRADRGDDVRLVRWARHPAVPWVALVAVLWLGQLQGSMLFTARDDWVAALLHPALALAFAALVLHLTQRAAPAWLVAPWLRVTALISYSIYLWHYPLLVKGFEAADVVGQGLAPTPAKAAVLAVLVVVIWAVGAASYLVAERPAIRARARRAVRP